MAIPDDALWRVEFRQSARDELDDVEDGIRFEILGAIVDLAEDPVRPTPSSCAATQICTGSNSEKQRKVIIERVRPRSTAYIGLRDPDAP